MPQLGPLEILVIFVVALLVFGPSKLPEIGRQVGKGVSEFRRFQQTLRQDLDGMLGGHDDQRDAAAPSPTLPPRETVDVSEPPGSEFGPTAPSSEASNEEPNEASGGQSGEPSGASSGADPGEPMLPLPWPDPVPLPPPPDAAPPIDETP